MSRTADAPAPGANNDYPKTKATFVIFKGLDGDKRSRKLRIREMNATVPVVPQWLNGSETAITWDRRDHPDCLPNPGRYALVVDPIVSTDTGDFRITKVLMDGGSSINLLGNGVGYTSAK